VEESFLVPTQCQLITSVSNGCAVACVEGFWKLFGLEWSAGIGATARLPPLSYAMEPEQMTILQRNHDYEVVRASSDVWAVGRIFYECLTRKSPSDFMRPCTFDEVLSLHESCDP
jgi:hypothetical protein